MNVTENMMLQQMQQMAANMAGSLPQTGGSKDQTSFQDMMAQAGKTESTQDPEAPEQSAPEKPAGDSAASEKPQVKTEEKDAARVQEENGDPNAMQMVMDLFRPEIVDVSEAEAAVEVPVEVPVEAAAEVSVETPVPAQPAEMVPAEAEAPLAEPVPAEETAIPVRQDAQPAEQQQEEAPAPRESVQEPVREVRQEEAVQETAEQPREVRQETAEAAPEQKTEAAEVRKEDAPEAAGEKPEEKTSDSQGGEGAQLQQPLFRGAEAAPVKVAENYKSVDTQQPDMDEKLAANIQKAADDGVQQVEIKLNPVHLGQITIELTRGDGGVLQVAIHAANGKAESLLAQHLDGLHAALQAYGQEVKVEVQRGQETPQQQNQNQHQTNPDGHQQNRQHHQQQEHKEEHSGDFLQKLRLGLVETDSL